LHEEILTAGGVIREGRFSRLNVTQVRDALAAQLDAQPSDEMKERLRALWPQLAAPLYQALEARTKERTAGIEKLLADRADQEVAKITVIMQELARSIRAELDHPDHQQLELFTSSEREQFERNIDSLRARLAALPGELEKETAQIRARFADPQPRLFPVAVTFLTPQRLAGRGH